MTHTTTPRVDIWKHGIYKWPWADRCVVLRAGAPYLELVTHDEALELLESDPDVEILTEDVLDHGKHFSIPREAWEQAVARKGLGLRAEDFVIVTWYTGAPYPQLLRHEEFEMVLSFGRCRACRFDGAGAKQCSYCGQPPFAIWGKTL